MSGTTYLVSIIALFLLSNYKVQTMFEDTFIFYVWLFCSKHYRNKYDFKSIIQKLSWKDPLNW